MIVLVVSRLNRQFVGEVQGVSVAEEKFNFRRDYDDDTKGHEWILRLK